MVVLDTDHVSFLERGDSSIGIRLRARLAPLSVAEKAVTIISFEEQTRGWMAVLAKAKSMAQQIEAYRRLRWQLNNFCSIRVLDFEERAAAEFQRLRQSRLRVAPMDLKIAAVVLVHGATLLSRNRGDFGKVPGLKVEDWTT